MLQRNNVPHWLIPPARIYILQGRVIFSLQRPSQERNEKSLKLTCVYSYYIIAVSKLQTDFSRTAKDSTPSYAEKHYRDSASHIPTPCWDR